MDRQDPNEAHRPTDRPRRRRVRPGTLIVGALALFLIVVSAMASGFGGALVMAGIIVLLTGLYVLVTGRPSWLRLQGRKAGAITVVASVVITGFGGFLMPPVEEPVTTKVSDTGASQAATSPTATRTPTRTPTTAAETQTSKPAPSPTPTPKPSRTAAPPKDEPAKKEKKDDAAASAGTALALLQTIDIKGRAPKTGYDRDQYGSAWTDVDGNFCDTRNDILLRDLTSVVFNDDCEIATGLLAGPFTATAIHFVRGVSTSSDVQVDHLVALSDSWQKGAQQLAPNQREAFANDPLNLLAVDGPTNASKGDGDAATWLPPNKAFRCEYVALQTAVKAKYDLWVTQAEHNAIAGILATKCPNQPVPADNGGVAVPIAAGPAPVVEETVAPPPAPEAPGAPSDVYYENCDAVRAGDADPIRAGDPGWDTKFDRDGNGVGCQ